MARRATRAALLCAAACAWACWPRPLRPCWTPPRGADGPDRQDLPRRALLGSLGALGAQPAAAEETFTLRTEPVGEDPYLASVLSPQRDFSIQLPTTWQTEFNNYAGRLILSMTPFDMEEVRNSGGEPDLVAVRCARLPLPALLRSAKFMPREGDEQRSAWKEVVLGDVTGANVAEWLMRAGQEAQMAQAGLQLPQINISVADYEISDGPGGSSVLKWHALSQITGPLGQDPNEQVQGLGGKSLVPVSEAFGRAPTVPGREAAPQATTGKAILRNGVVTFALALSPARRIDPSYKGPLGKKYLDYMVDSLKLTS